VFGWGSVAADISGLAGFERRGAPVAHTGAEVAALSGNPLIIGPPFVLVVSIALETEVEAELPRK